jgi:hypothetical protein
MRQPHCSGFPDPPTPNALLPRTVSCSSRCSTGGSLRIMPASPSTSAWVSSGVQLLSPPPSLSSASALSFSLLPLADLAAVVPTVCVS